jgi:hypothetical protein
MKEKNLLLLIVVIVVLIFLYFCGRESYTDYKDPHITQYAQKSKNPPSVQLTKIGTREGADPLEGLLFSDVTFYEGSHTVDGDLGLERCIKNCKGMCMEFGQTGDAYCFPADYANISLYPVKSDLHKNAIHPNDAQNNQNVTCFPYDSAKSDEDIVCFPYDHSRLDDEKLANIRNYPVKTQIPKITFPTT